MPFSGLALGRAGRKRTQRFRRRAGENDIGCDHGTVIFPPAGKGEGTLDILRILCVFVDADRNRKFRANLWLDAEQGKHTGVGCRLIRAFSGQTAFHRLDEIVFGFVCIHVADFNMGFVERRLTVSHADEQARAVFLDQRVVLKLQQLRFGQILEGSVHITACLSEVLLLKRVVDGCSNGKQ